VNIKAAPVARDGVLGIGGDDGVLGLAGDDGLAGSLVGQLAKGGDLSLGPKLPVSTTL
jgi:hypothetical protein